MHRSREPDADTPYDELTIQYTGSTYSTVLYQQSTKMLSPNIEESALIGSRCQLLAAVLHEVLVTNHNSCSSLLPYK